DYNKPAGTYNIAFNLQALPQVTQYYMQDLVNTVEDPNLTTRVCTETPTMVMDKRDGHTYAIARLKDGKCWMVQNLRLGENLEPVTGSLTLTDEDTNISTTDEYNPRSTFTLTNQVVDGKMPEKAMTDPVGGSIGYIYDGPAFYCTNDYGCYYNFYTATAGIKSEGSGTDTVTTKNTDVTTTICPKNWTLPTGGDHQTSEYPNHSSDLYSTGKAYGVGTDSIHDILLKILALPVGATENINGTYIPGFLLGGVYYSGGAYGEIGTYGRYWARTVPSAIYGNGLYLATASFNFNDRLNRYDGRSVRCLLQE
ncbi:hypothetical protein IKF23_01725, partial [Candidatus Saccharibacteria bacterium]|nr:hypothetical protein [Candidatus Saccharibacteria bacterium]